MDHDEECPVCKKYMERWPFDEHTFLWRDEILRQRQAGQKHDQ